MTVTSPARVLQPGPRAAEVHARQAARERLRHLELSRRGESRHHRARQPLLDDERGAPRRAGPASRIRSTPIRALFQQGIAGTLELFFLAWELFQDVVQEVTGHPVPMYQRVDHAGHKLPIDERILADTDTLMVFGLDHMVTEQEASRGRDRSGAASSSVAREPASSWGRTTTSASTPDLKQRAMEYAHHGDALVPRQQRFGKYTRVADEGARACRSRTATDCARPRSTTSDLRRSRSTATSTRAAGSRA